MRLLSDIFVKIVIDDHSYNVHISLALVRSWSRVFFILVDFVVFFFLFHYWTSFSKETSFITLHDKKTCCQIRHLRWVVRVNDSSRSRFVQINFLLPLRHWIFGFLRISPGCSRSTMESWTLWVLSRFISP